jgi:hypothetical protein
MFPVTNYTGKRISDDGFSAKSWWVFDATLTNEQILAHLHRCAVRVEGYRSHAEAGAEFATRVYIKRGVSRVLATQTEGLDV